MSVVTRYWILDMFTFMLGSGPSVDCPSLQAGLIFILLAERQQDWISRVSHLTSARTGHTLITPQLTSLTSLTSHPLAETQLSWNCSYRKWPSNNNNHHYYVKPHPLPTKRNILGESHGTWDVSTQHLSTSAPVPRKQIMSNKTLLVMVMVMV